MLNYTSNDARPDRQPCGDGTRREERAAAAAGEVTMLPPGAWNGSHLREEHGIGAKQRRVEILVSWRRHKVRLQRARRAPCSCAAARVLEEGRLLHSAAA